MESIHTSTTGLINDEGGVLDSLELGRKEGMFVDGRKRKRKSKRPNSFIH